MLFSGYERFKSDSYDNDKEKRFVGKTDKKIAQDKRKTLKETVETKAFPQFADLIEERGQVQNYAEDGKNKAGDKIAGQKHSRESLQHMTDEIMKQVTLIMHELLWSSFFVTFVAKNYWIVA